MTAAAPVLRLKASIILPATPEMPRQLSVELSVYNFLDARMSSQSVYICGGIAQLEDCYLKLSKDSPFLCIGNVLTCRLTVSEAADVLATFEQYGLVIK